MDARWLIVEAPSLGWRYWAGACHDGCWFAKGECAKVMAESLVPALLQVNNLLS
jgi:hypothetical protein